jgi:hypothetical protein
MKHIINIILEDFRKEGFTRKEYIRYGILAPITYIIIVIILSALE